MPTGIIQWLEQLGLDQYAAVFEENALELDHWTIPVGMVEVQTWIRLLPVMFMTPPVVSTRSIWHSAPALSPLAVVPCCCQEQAQDLWRRARLHDRTRPV